MTSEVAAGPEESSEAENHRYDRIYGRKKYEAGRVDLLNIEQGSKNNLYVSMFLLCTELVDTLTSAKDKHRISFSWQAC